MFGIIKRYRCVHCHTIRRSKWGISRHACKALMIWSAPHTPTRLSDIGIVNATHLSDIGIEDARIENVEIRCWSTMLCRSCGVIFSRYSEPNDDHCCRECKEKEKNEII